VQRLAEEPLNGELFYPLSKFQLCRRKPLEFPSHLRLSNNYYNRTWSGWRRIKNVNMVLDLLPQGISAATVKALPLTPALMEAALAALRHMWRMFTRCETGKEEDASLSRAGLMELLIAYLGAGEDEDDDEVGDDDEGDEEEEKTKEPSLRKTPTVDADSTGRLVSDLASRVLGGSHEARASFGQVRDAILGPMLRRLHAARYTLVLSLEEAETLRRVVHLQQDEGTGMLVAGQPTAAALRCHSAGDVVLDSTPGYGPSPDFMEALNRQSLRFFDGEQFYTPRAVRALLGAVQVNAVLLRQMFFENVVSCRRRAMQAWKDTPLSQALTVNSEFELMMQAAAALSVGSTLAERGLLVHEAFELFDRNKDKMLDAEEVMSMLMWLGFSPTAADVLDFLEITDQDGDGRVGYHEFVRGVQQIRRRVALSPAAHSALFKNPQLVTPSPQVRDDLRKAMLQRKAKAAQQAERLARLKAEEMALLAVGDAKEHAAREADTTQTSDCHFAFVFTRGRMSTKVENCGGMGEFMPVTFATGGRKRKSKSGVPQDDGIRYCLRLESNTCLRVPVPLRGASTCRRYTVTLNFKLQRTPPSRALLLSFGGAGLVITKDMALALVPLDSEGSIAGDVKEAPRWHPKVLPLAGGSLPATNAKTGAAPAAPGLDAEAVEQANTRRDGLQPRSWWWHVLSLVVDCDESRAWLYLDGEPFATSLCPDGMALCLPVATGAQAAGEKGGKKRSKDGPAHAKVGLLGDPRDQTLSDGGDLQQFQFHYDPLSPAEVLTLHVELGAWRCTKCGAGNCASNHYCWGCNERRKRSGVAPPDNADPDHPGLTIVVSDTFESIVLDERKHVFLDLCATWCGPCQAMAPEWERLARLLRGSNDVVIAKMDMDANERDPRLLPEQSVPTIKLFPKGKNKRHPILYRGERDVAGFMAFLEQHAQVRAEDLLKDSYAGYRQEKKVAALLARTLACAAHYVPAPGEPGLAMAGFFEQYMTEQAAISAEDDGGSKSAMARPALLVLRTALGAGRASLTLGGILRLLATLEAMEATLRNTQPAEPVAQLAAMFRSVPRKHQDHHGSICGFAPLTVSHVQPMELDATMELWASLVPALLSLEEDEGAEDHGQHLQHTAEAEATPAVLRKGVRSGSDGTGQTTPGAAGRVRDGGAALEALEAAWRRGLPADAAPYGQTLVHWAAVRGRLDLLDWLYVNGADLHKPSAQPRRADARFALLLPHVKPIEVAAALGHHRLVEFCLQRGCAPGFALHAAAANGQVQCLQALLDAGAYAGLCLSGVSPLALAVANLQSRCALALADAEPLAVGLALPAPYAAARGLRQGATAADLAIAVGQRWLVVRLLDVVSRARARDEAASRVVEAADAADVARAVLPREAAVELCRTLALDPGSIPLHDAEGVVTAAALRQLLRPWLGATSEDALAMYDGALAAIRSALASRPEPTLVTPTAAAALRSADSPSSLLSGTLGLAGLQELSATGGGATRRQLLCLAALTNDAEALTALLAVPAGKNATAVETEDAGAENAGAEDAGALSPAFFASLAQASEAQKLLHDAKVMLTPVDESSLKKLDLCVSSAPEADRAGWRYLLQAEAAGWRSAARLSLLEPGLGLGLGSGVASAASPMPADVFETEGATMARAAMAAVAHQDSSAGVTGLEAGDLSSGMTLQEYVASLSHMRLSSAAVAACLPAAAQAAQADQALAVCAPPMTSWTQVLEMARLRVVLLVAQGETLPPPLCLALVLYLRFTGLTPLCRGALVAAARDGIQKDGVKEAVDAVAPLCDGISRALAQLPPLHGATVYVVAPATEAKALLSLYRRGRVVHWPAYALATRSAAVAMAWATHKDGGHRTGQRGGAGVGVGVGAGPATVVLKVRARTVRDVAPYASAPAALALCLFNMDTSLSVLDYHPLDMTHMQLGAGGAAGVVALDSVQPRSLSVREVRSAVSRKTGFIISLQEREGL
jgi:thiol-disulfide isomerase/thioredoxin